MCTHKVDPDWKLKQFREVSARYMQVPRPKTAQPTPKAKAGSPARPESAVSQINNMLLVMPPVLFEKYVILGPCTHKIGTQS